VVNVAARGPGTRGPTVRAPERDTRFEGVATAYGAAVHAGLSGGAGHLECEVREHVAAGTHTIFLAGLSTLSFPPTEKPLAYFRGSFGRLHPALEGAASDSAPRRNAVCPRASSKPCHCQVGAGRCRDRELHTLARNRRRMDELHSEDVLVDVDGFSAQTPTSTGPLLGSRRSPASPRAFDRLELGPLLVRTQAGQARCASQLIEVHYATWSNALLDRDVEAATSTCWRTRRWPSTGPVSLSGATRH